jgi:toxin ParE1/3/4
MRKIHVHALAESDLIDIWRYSFEEWGEAQADKYLDELDGGIYSLADNPEIGIKRDYLRDGYRVLFVGSHAEPLIPPNFPAATAVLLHAA